MWSSETTTNVISPRSVRTRNVVGVAPLDASSTSRTMGMNSWRVELGREQLTQGSVELVQRGYAGNFVALGVEQPDELVRRGQGKCPHRQHAHMGRAIRESHDQTRVAVQGELDHRREAPYGARLGAM